MSRGRLSHVRHSRVSCTAGETTRRGQLGNGTLTSSSSRSASEAPADWTGISAGFSAHTCGIRSNRALYCWGDNTDGQLGDNTTTDRTVPTRVGTATGWTLVSAGGHGSYDSGFTEVTGQTCRLFRAGGQLYCWGDNSDGEIGDGTMTNRLTPTRIGSADDWNDISAGASHSCGIRAGGALYCWGANVLGDGTSTISDVPVQNELGGWISVSAGQIHTKDCGHSSTPRRSPCGSDHLTRVTTPMARPRSVRLIGIVGLGAAMLLPPQRARHSRPKR